MSPVLATPSTTKLNAPSPSTVSHQYGTRIRSNSVIRPSARLRQSPDPPPPRKIKPAPVAKAKPAVIAPEPVPADQPLFPPPNVMLHADDSTSRVFLAVGRALMSVDNCAMTIKDLADVSMKFGLACQNASAAGQAITTYIRNHIIRCDAQEDHPLLLRHTMSGTPSDDELVAALHSRVGGAHCMINVAENRVTNFRRGTVVWYLSKAAGAPCPFARAGITLSDYTENGKVGEAPNSGRERKRERDRMRRAEQCGQKRKRLVRACADRQDSDSESSEDEQRPPKVKLTLRLKRPSAAIASDSRCPSPTTFIITHTSDVIDLSRDDSSDSDAMYCSSSESDDEDEEDEPAPWSNAAGHASPALTHGSQQPVASSSTLPDATRRSFSIPFSTLSVSSPPPDSEDEDDFEYGAAGIRRTASGRSRNESDYPLEDDDEFDSDFLSARDVDMETHWEESPGPRSPSVQFEDGPVVKSEPRDVQGLLDAWDDLDLAVTDRKVVDVVAQAAAAGESDPSHAKEPHMWSWENFTDNPENDFAYIWDQRLSPQVKPELDAAVTLDSLPTFEPLPVTESPLSPYSSYSAATSPRDFVPDDSVSWEDASALSPESAAHKEGEDGILPSSLTKSAEDVASDSVPATFEPATRSLSPCSPSSIPPMMIDINANVFAETQPPLSPQILLSSSPASSSGGSRLDPNARDKVFVYTLEPCVPAIWATELEGVPVYQMMLGSALILRRIDTDYVKISRLHEFLGVDASASAHPDAVEVSQGSTNACGTWVPTGIARQAISDHTVDAFLSEDLETRFPPTLDELRHSVTQGTLPHPFGRHFQSTIDARRHSFPFRLQLEPRAAGMAWEAVEDHLLSVHPPYALASAVAPAKLPVGGTEEAQTPLSPSEEEIFHALCGVSDDWETPLLLP
ncbi:hypothetical protein EIP91_002706 [Steccherinum ochraceum]|uniref:HTH APSES-type domain-containing protein n=1 Tax=Steccherinum ochraceum TaxID=92696 RepID=A0A4V2MW98_9APHY|nr:hypothetical protein EIP91_002706 [Steccherinum ochraceum]